MNDMFRKYINDLALQQPTSLENITLIESRLNISFPKDYVSFILESNGAEGAIGENGYIQLWAIDVLIQHNERYEVKEFAPGVTLFGSNGGNVAYGFFEKSRETHIIEVPLMGMDKELIRMSLDTGIIKLEMSMILFFRELQDISFLAERDTISKKINKAQQQIKNMLNITTDCLEKRLEKEGW
ncbi:SMI1/KNR4 family protein [Bacillus cereus group sp. BfR-BA-01380]|uniref:SMI1/KNR4 family protein n=1 Tax=Bacillus cereus group sp. BfR-BA-01380 TaxID=2920324 RepID=UPI001F57EBB0|nr:SMI1/KNR4 family protein [Bacillus cereus group sp. BfR-BA-01380]